MKIQFISPISLQIVSGGNRYNSAIIEGLRLKGLTIDYNFSPVNKAYDLTIVDSLSMSKIHPKELNHTNKTIIALIHQLPELDDSQIDFYKTHAKFIVTGTTAKDQLIRKWQLDENTVNIIRPGVPKNWTSKTVFKSKPDSVIIVSNFIENKGYEMLIKLLNKLSYLDIKYEIIGNHTMNSSYAKKIIPSIQDTKTKVNFHFNLNQNELHHQLINADIFLSLSKSESFGMAIYEALVLGLPCLCYKTGDYHLFSNYINYIGIDDYSVNRFSDIITQMFNHSSTYTSYCNSSIKQSRYWEQVVNEFSTYILNTVTC